jgi:hypothetical protein
MGEPVQDPPAAPPAAEGDAPAGPSKSELKKRAKEAEKAKKTAERLAREEEERKAREAAASVDNASQNYGKLPLHQSQEKTGRARLKFPQLSEEMVGQNVIFRARLHNMRPQGAKIVFLQFRQQTETLQGVLVASGEKDENQVSKQMLKFAQGITVRYPFLSSLRYLTDGRLNHSSLSRESSRRPKSNLVPSRPTKLESTNSTLRLKLVAFHSRWRMLPGQSLSSRG